MIATNKERVFVDTYIWFYALFKQQNVSKYLIAKDIINQKSVVISTQIINEISRNLVKKGHFQEQEIRELIFSFYENYVVSKIDEESMLIASDIREKYNISFWDSLVIASTLQNDIPVLYSEDMQNGLEIDNKVVITNPFIL